MMTQGRMVTVGKIVGAHGIRGEVKVLSFAESSGIFAPGNDIHAKTASGADTIFRIKSAKPHKNIVRLALDGIKDRNTAQGLVGAELQVPREVLPDLPEGEWYHCDLIGLSVFTEDGAFLGKLAYIIETGANDVFAIKNQDNEILVPAIDSVVKKVDLDDGKIVLSLPEGLSSIKS